MKKYSDYNINAPDYGSGEYLTLCPECSSKRKVHNQRKKCLSVNLAKATWYCHHCGWKGHLEFTEDEKEEYARIHKKIFQKTSISDDDKKLHDKTEGIISWFKSRNISKETLDIVKISSKTRFLDGSSQNLIAFPFYRNGEIVNVKYRSKQKSFTQSKGGLQCLYNYDGVKYDQEIILTEGEIDCLSLIECGYNAVCSCPNGAPPLNTKNYESKLEFIRNDEQLFNQFSKIILCMDKDEVGLNWQKIISEYIGIEKCFIVDYPEDCKDINDVLCKHGKEKVIECVDNYKSIPIKGIVEIRDIQEEICNYYKGDNTQNYLTTSWIELDYYYKFNKNGGDLNILTGIPNSGKSEILDQLIINSIARHGYKWGIYSPENYPLKRHFKKFAEKYNSKTFWKSRFNGFERINPKELCQTCQSLDKNIKFVFSDDETFDLEKILSIANVLCVRNKINGFVIDPWNEIDHSRQYGMSETDYINKSLTKIRTFARANNCDVWIVAHPFKLEKLKDGEYPIPTPYDISGSAHWRNKGDNCFAVWRPLTTEGQNKDNHVKFCIQKIRDKEQGRTGYIRLEWLEATGVYKPIKNTKY